MKKKLKKIKGKSLLFDYTLPRPIDNCSTGTRPDPHAEPVQDLNRMSSVVGRVAKLKIKISTTFLEFPRIF